MYTCMYLYKVYVCIHIHKYVHTYCLCIYALKSLLSLSDRLKDESNFEMARCGISDFIEMVYIRSQL